VAETVISEVVERRLCGTGIGSSCQLQRRALGKHCRR
jgi:hypothetical protein